jgi:SAM-dependent methyltransferase
MNMELTDKPWDAIFKRDGRVFHEPAEIVIKFAGLLAEHGCTHVFDLGCGSGRHTVFLAQNGFSLYAGDNSPAALCLTRHWLAEQSLSAKLVLTDSRQTLPFRTGAFDGLLTTQVIHHAKLAVVRGTAAEISRVVRPGGLLLVTVPANVKSDGESVEIERNTFVPLTGSEKGFPHHIFTPEELCDSFESFRTFEVAVLGGVVIALLGVRK